MVATYPYKVPAEISLNVMPAVTKNYYFGNVPPSL
jgi:hypothetical protein